MAGFFEEEGLFVEQTENASEASAERGKSAAATAAGRGREEGGKGRATLPILLDEGLCASIVYLPTATQYSFAKGCEGPPRPKGCRSLSQSHFDSR